MTEPLRAEHAENRARPFDADILRRVRGMSPDALDLFFQHFYDRAYGYVAMLLGDRHAAEDVTHEAFLRMHRALPRLDPERDPTPWVFAVLSNTVRDHWRSAEWRSIARRTGLEEARDVIAPRGHSDPEEAFSRTEERRSIEKALGELNPGEREVILLRAQEGMATAEIATVLGAREDAIRQRLSRATRKFGEVYAQLVGRGTAT